MKLKNNELEWGVANKFRIAYPLLTFLLDSFPWLITASVNQHLHWYMAKTQKSILDS